MVKESAVNKILLDDLITDGETVHAYSLVGGYCFCYCISSDGSDDIAAAIEETLHRLLEAGADNECILRWTGLCKEETLAEEMSEDHAYIDLGYVLPGRVLQWLSKEKEWSSYVYYRDQWLARHGIQANIYGDCGLGYPFSSLHKACVELFGKPWLAFDEFMRKKNLGILPELPSNDGDVIVMTPKGRITAKIMPDEEYPGILLEYDSGDGRPGALLEYNPTREEIQLRIYGKDEPDGDPVAVYGMS